MQRGRLEEIISKIPQTKVAVLGDFFLDLYIQLDRSLSEFSLETHKEAFQAVNLRGQPGTAGVVINNLTALGAQSAAIAYIGNDGNGYTLKKALEAQNTNTLYLIETSERFTPTYTKPMMQEVDGSNIELNRIDIINRSPNSSTLNQALADYVRKAIQTYDGILVVEQVKQDGFGTMSPLLRRVLTELAGSYPQKTIMVDSRHFASEYHQVSLKMNLSEAVKACKTLGPQFSSLDKEYPIDTAKLCAEAFWKANRQPVFITLSELGIAGMAEGNFFYHPGFQIKGPIDIVGAGDSVLAGIGLAMCLGASAQEAAYIGNLVGSITVQQIGTTGIATRDELRKRHKEYQQQMENRNQ